MNWEWSADFRRGLRLLRLEPVISGAMVGTMVLSIGAVSAVASLVYGVMYRPLPYPDSARFVQFSWTDGHNPPPFRAVGLLDLRDWRERSTTMEEVAGWMTVGATMLADGEPLRVTLAEVTEGFDHVLGSAPALGRFFTASELASAADRVLVLSNRFWRAQLGADPGVIGRELVLDGVAHMVVGVLPRLPLEYPPGGVDAWIPLTRPPYHWSLRVRGASWLNAVGRIRPTTDLPAAQAEMAALQARLVESFPRSQESQSSVLLEPLRDVLVAPARQALSLLGLSVAVILLMASANLGVLLLARASRRADELSIRVALGASATRIRRQLLAESLVVTGLGGALGLLAAPWALEMIVALFPGGLPRGDEVRLDWAIVLGAVTTMGLASVTAGLLPATRARKRDLQRHLRTAAGTDARRFREGLAGVQVALSVFLLIAAALFVQTQRNLSAVDTGFDGESVLAFRLTPAPARYPSPTRLKVFYSELVTQLRSVGGVREVGLANFAPFTAGDWGHGFRVVGEAINDPETPSHPANVRLTDGGYYATLRIPLISGRLLDERDREGSAPVALLNESAAAEAFPDGEAVGRLLEFEGAEREIVGIVSDVRHHTLAESPSPEIHLPIQQMPPSSVWVVVGAVASESAVLGDIRAAVRRADPTVALVSLATYRERLAGAVEGERFRAALVGGLGMLAAAIALLGIYGTLSNTVSRRRREIGIRLALGEARGGVVGRMLGRAATLAVWGVIPGLLAAAAISNRVEQLLFGIEARDATTYLAVASVVWSVGVLAGLGPALSASRLDPMEIMRDD